MKEKVSLVAQMVKNLPDNAGDLDLVPGLGRSPGDKNGYLLHYSYLGNPMDRGAWYSTACGVTKSQSETTEQLTLNEGKRLLNVS